MPPSPADTPAGAESDGGRLDQALALVGEAEGLLRSKQIDEAVQAARRATAFGVGQDRSWRVLAQALEAQGDYAGAGASYELALSHAPDVAELAGEVGLFALRVCKYGKAESLLTAHLEGVAPTAAAVASLAQAQIGLMAFDRAHETLKTALEAAPGESVLWLTLGQLLCVEGRHAQALIFFEEALRLDPGSALARAGLADALLLGGGEVEAALSWSQEALAAATLEELPVVTASHARRLLAAGRLAEGWAALAKGVGPGDAALIEVKAAAPRWAGDKGLDGRLLLMGEESLGDEILLSHAIPAIVVDGPALILAVDPRWESLARRSFPGVKVVPMLGRLKGGKWQEAATLDSPQLHDGEPVAAWTPLRSMMAAHRGGQADFADTGPYLQPDPARVDYWRERLAGLGPGPKIGVVWRSPSLGGVRPWEAPPLPALQAPLSLPGIHPIALQHEAFLGELGWIERVYGLTIHEPPPELDRDDLDDLAALTRALDVVIGPPEAQTLLAAACGARTWILSTPRHWAMLGTGAYPWFPKARVIAAQTTNDWDEAMTELGQAIAALAVRLAVA